MHHIIRQVQSAPWRTVLESAHPPEVRQAATLMANLDRATWQVFVPPLRAGMVPEISAGSGARASDRELPTMVSAPLSP